MGPVRRSPIPRPRITSRTNPIHILPRHIGLVKPLCSKRCSLCFFFFLFFGFLLSVFCLMIPSFAVWKRIHGRWRCQDGLQKLNTARNHPEPEPQGVNLQGPMWGIPLHSGVQEVPRICDLCYYTRTAQAFVTTAQCPRLRAFTVLGAGTLVPYGGYMRGPPGYIQGRIVNGIWDM